MPKTYFFKGHNTSQIKGLASECNSLSGDYGNQQNVASAPTRMFVEYSSTIQDVCVTHISPSLQNRRC